MTSHDRRGAPDSEPVDLSALLDDAPPASQEGRLMAALRAGGEFAPRGRRWLRVAASVALFAAGLVAGVAWQSRGVGGVQGPEPLESPPLDGEPAWALMLLDGPGYGEAPDAAEAELRVAALAGWAAELANAGRLVIAEELGSPVGTLPRTAPSRESAELGLFIVRAADADEAVAIAADSPHLDHGGRIAVHPIVAH
jgi:hypothetical protein